MSRATTSFNPELTRVYGKIMTHEAQYRSPRALVSFGHLARCYFRWLDDEELDITHMGLRDAERYQQYCAQTISRTGQPYGTPAVRNMVNAASTVHTSLKRIEPPADNPFLLVRRVAHQSQPIRNVLKEPQLYRLLEYLADFETRGGSTKAGQLRAYRVHVVCELQAACGLRIDEVAKLAAGDLDVESSRLWVRCAKGETARMAYLTEEAGALLGDYLAYGRPVVMTMLPCPHDDRLFGISTRNLSESVNRALETACRELDLPRITSHGFRHSLGYHLLRAGCDVRYIQAILGHDQIESTAIYTKVDKDLLAQVLNTYHPRARFPQGTAHP